MVRELVHLTAEIRQLEVRGFERRELRGTVAGGDAERADPSVRLEGKRPTERGSKRCEIDRITGIGDQCIPVTNRSRAC